MKDNSLFGKRDLKVVNLGLEVFHSSVTMQNQHCVQVDWWPPAGGNVRLIEIIDRLRDLR